MSLTAKYKKAEIEIIEEISELVGDIRHSAIVEKYSRMDYQIEALNKSIEALKAIRSKS